MGRYGGNPYMGYLSIRSYEWFSVHGVDVSSLSRTMTGGRPLLGSQTLGILSLP